ncbi:MAG: flippase-like domain-containing protein [Chloroflexi bacterium]|nr:flippase-like domain-containing protein [Chloroflexota bacterium]
MRSANYVFIALAALVILATFGVRAMRWSWLLHPVRILPWRSLFSVVLIGFFGNYVLPAKTGELVRAYVLGRRESLSKSAILGTIAVEKTMDTLILFIIFLATLWAVPLPAEYTSIEPAIAVFLAVVIGAMLLLAARGRHASNLLVRVLQFVFPWWKERVARITHSFVDGLSVLYHGSSIGMVLALSLVIWLMTTLNFWLIGQALGLEVPLYGYVIIVAVTNMASFIPSLPGRFGTLELFSVAVLSLFSVGKNTAVLFPILLRVAQLAPILLGYIFLNREGVKILDVQKAAKETTTASASL